MAEPGLGFEHIALGDEVGGYSVAEPRAVRQRAGVTNPALHRVSHAKVVNRLWKYLSSFLERMYNGVWTARSTVADR